MLLCIYSSSHLYTISKFHYNISAFSARVINEYITWHQLWTKLWGAPLVTYLRPNTFPFSIRYFSILFRQGLTQCKNLCYFASFEARNIRHLQTFRIRCWNTWFLQISKRIFKWSGQGLQECNSIVYTCISITLTFNCCVSRSPVGSVPYLLSPYGNTGYLRICQMTPEASAQATVLCHLLMYWV